MKGLAVGGGRVMVGTGLLGVEYIMYICIRYGEFRYGSWGEGGIGGVDTLWWWWCVCWGE